MRPLDEVEHRPENPRILLISDLVTYSLLIVIETVLEKQNICGASLSTKITFYKVANLLSVLSD